jgi:mono/diheme cytochrome c family protein
VAIDREAARAVAWSQFDGVLRIFALGGAAGEKTPAPIAVPMAAHQALSPELDRGRKLFHDAAGGRIALDGRACASCHVDGRDDGLTWLTIEGAFQTPMLLLHDGRHATLAELITGMDGKMGHTRQLSSEDREALTPYVASL